MIRAVDIRDPQKTPVSWLKKAYPEPRRFEFTPGLNILWGENGSGKSSLIELLARSMHCMQSGSTVVTRDSARDVRDRMAGVDIDHDGQAVRYFEPSHAVGLVCNGAGFDDEFFAEGLVNATLRISAGQTTIVRLDKLIGQLLERTTPAVEIRAADLLRFDGTNESDDIQSFLKGSGQKGPPTVLLDEPERSMDLPKQAMLWRFIRSLASEVQFIVAAHSLFALNLPEANYIELGAPKNGKSYMQSCVRCLDLLSTWPAEKPPPPARQGKKTPKAKKAAP